MQQTNQNIINQSERNVKTTPCVTIIELDKKKTVYFKDVLSIIFINKHYHLYARRSKAKHRDAQGLLKEYTESLTWMLKKYPLQWFNYFDFWDSKNT